MDVRFLAIAVLLLATTGCLQRRVELVMQHPVVATEPDVHQLQEKHEWYGEDGVVCTPEEVSWDNDCIKAKKKTGENE